MINDHYIYKDGVLNDFELSTLLDLLIEKNADDCNGIIYNNILFSLFKNKNMDDADKKIIYWLFKLASQYYTKRR
jgi:hypothetical protein